MPSLTILWRCFFVTLLFAPATIDAMTFQKPTPEQWRHYWNNQGAEITHYDLSKVRYGETHKGSTILVFVTEPFNRQKQVKSDTSSGKDVVPILKLNHIEKFNTGIYRYSIMVSTFSAINTTLFPLPFKISMSAQEWCGHQFSQLNLRPPHYQVKRYSYFESESDRQFQLDAIITEDSLWNLIRINPSKLPTGSFKLIQGSVQSRLHHNELQVQQVHGELAFHGWQKKMVAYKLTFKKTQRVLKIIFQRKFPFQIESWHDTQKTAKWIKPSLTLTTEVRLLKRVRSFYWKKNKPKDRALRNELGLTF